MKCGIECEATVTGILIADVTAVDVLCPCAAGVPGNRNALPRVGLNRAVIIIADANAARRPVFDKQFPVIAIFRVRLQKRTPGDITRFRIEQIPNHGVLFDIGTARGVRPVVRHRVTLVGGRAGKRHDAFASRAAKERWQPKVVGRVELSQRCRIPTIRHRARAEISGQVAAEVPDRDDGMGGTGPEKNSCQEINRTRFAQYDDGCTPGTLNNWEPGTIHLGLGQN